MILSRVQQPITKARAHDAEHGDGPVFLNAQIAWIFST